MAAATQPATVPTRSELADLAARALHFYERLEQPGRAPRPIDPAALESTLERWREVLGDDAPDLFERRLARDGLTLDDWRSAQSPAAWPAELPLPEWTRFLAVVLEDLAGWTEERAFRPPPEPAHRYPFHAVVLPFVDAAEARLRAECSDDADPIPEALIEAGREHLANRLCHQASLVLHLEFTLFLHPRESGLERALRRARGESSERSYRAFVERFYRGHWRQLLAEYPVLGRQLATCCLQWVEHLEELWGRWRDDRDRLEERFPHLDLTAPPRRFELGRSDRHNDGRSTAFVELEGGRKLVYKPKPLGTDAVVDDLLAWLGDPADGLSWNHVGTLDRGAYGWQEWVDQTPCRDRNELRDFYHRTGGLLALVYALEGYDVHHENTIAHGACPLLVDTETIFNPYKEMERRQGDLADAATLASETVFYSVLRTGMLPAWSVRRDGSHQDLTGLGGGRPGDDSDPHRLSRWVDVGTDDIRLEPRDEPVEPKGNQPTLASGEPVRPEDHVDLLRRGFADAYRRLLDDRDGFLALLHRHRRIPVRFVRKATRIYSDQLWWLLDPKCLRDGMAWSRVVEYQARMFVAADSDNPHVWGLLRQEYRALMAMDVPYFRVPADGLHIEDGTGRVVVPAYFDRDCLTRLDEKIRLLSEDDLALQDRYIAYSFYARAARSIHAVAPELAGTVPDKDDTSDLPPATDDDCLTEARRIADELLDEALRGADGSLAWVALEYLKEAEVFQLKPVSYNLYSGSMGVAVLLAAIGHVTGEERYTEAAHATLRPLVRILRREQRQVVRLSGLGIGVGLGSLVYGLATVAQWSEPERANGYLELAREALLSVDDDQILADRKHDLIFGTAGALLAWHKLQTIAPTDGAADAMRRLADHLLASRTGEPALVPTSEGRAVAGLSHGSSGVALALARAAHWTGEEAYARAALDHVAFEESLWDESRANYPDYRSRPGSPAFLTTWCHGAPGIALARLAHHRIAGEPHLLASARRALDTTHRFTLAHLDHICCGNLGRLDIQWEAACRQDDEAARTALRRDLSAVLAERRRLGGFRLFLNAPTQVFSPGLFTGASGIAYTLLRFAAPGRLPSILAFD